DNANYRVDRSGDRGPNRDPVNIALPATAGAHAPVVRRHVANLWESGYREPATCQAKYPRNGIHTANPKTTAIPVENQAPPLLTGSQSSQDSTGLTGNLRSSWYKQSRKRNARLGFISRTPRHHGAGFFTSPHSIRQIRQW